MLFCNCRDYYFPSIHSTDFIFLSFFPLLLNCHKINCEIISYYLFSLLLSLITLISIISLLLFSSFYNFCWFFLFYCYHCYYFYCLIIIFVIFIVLAALIVFISLIFEFLLILMLCRKVLSFMEKTYVWKHKNIMNLNIKMVQVLYSLQITFRFLLSNAAR